MSLDRDRQFYVDSKVVGTTRLPFTVPNDVYLLVYNTHATATITVYSGHDAANGIPIGPGKKRSLPRMPELSQIWIVSDTASTTVQVWRSATKWGNDWMADEALSVSFSAVQGELLTETQDTAQSGSATLNFDFAGTLTRYGKGFSFLADSLVEVEIILAGAVGGNVFRVNANEAFSFPPGPSPVDIDAVNITDLSGGTWHIDFVGY